MQEYIERRIDELKSEQIGLRSRIRIIEAVIGELNTVLQNCISDPAEASHSRSSGSISDRWRAILEHMAVDGNPERSASDVIDLVHRMGYELADSTVRNTLHRYARAGLIEKTEHGFRVSQDAIARYEFSTENGDFAVLDDLKDEMTQQLI